MAVVSRPMSPVHNIRIDPHQNSRLSSPAPGPGLGLSSTRPLSRSKSSSSRSSISSSVSPPPLSRTGTASPRLSTRPRKGSSSSSHSHSGAVGKENMPTPGSSTGDPMENGNGGGKAWRDGSLEPDDGTPDSLRRRNPPRNTRVKSTTPYDGLPTLPTISGPDVDGDAPFDDNFALESPTSLDGTIPLPASPSRPPPPARSAAMGTGDRPVNRTRRSSSVHRKLSPGVKPTKVVDWEIPRKTLHSSIGFLTLLLNYLNPPTITPLLTTLILGLVSVTLLDVLRLNFPGFAEVWEIYFGFLMRESERGKINGVVWYLVGVIFVLAVYPRDVAVVSILTLSWSDTTASTIGRLWGRLTPPLPGNFPGLKTLRFAPRKSLAGFLAATLTGFLICIGFWWNGSSSPWAVLNGESSAGLVLTAMVVGVGGAIVEALDLGVDDNLTLPILSGAIIWGWLSITNLLL